MANFTFNIAKGRVTQLAINVDTGSPANSRLILIPFDATDATEATIVDADTVAAVEAVTNVTERTTGGWNRKTLTSADVTVTTNDTSDRTEVDIPDQTWTAVTAGAVTAVLLAYDADNAAGTDSDLIPLTWHDFAITPDGSDVTATVADIFRAS
jgi:hypothetical protein